MNILPCQMDGAALTLAGHRIPYAGPFPPTADNLEIGIRPEYVQLSDQSGIPARITAIEDVGKHLVVRARLQPMQVNSAASGEISAIVRAGTTIPENPRVNLDGARINLYQDSILVTG